MKHPELVGLAGKNSSSPAQLMVRLVVATRLRAITQERLKGGYHCKWEGRRI